MIANASLNFPAATTGSAFPAVFRPHWSWEIYRRPEQVAQYADGGIMDNLPLGAVEHRRPRK